MARPVITLLVVSSFVVACAGAGSHEPKAPKSDPQSSSELVRIGREAAARGDAVRAEQYLGLAIERGVERRTLLPILLESCLRSSHLRAALNHAEPYLREHPEDDHLRYLIANIHLSLGQVGHAKRELELLLQRDARNVDAHYLLGIIEATSRPESAQRHFEAFLLYSNDEERRAEVESRQAELRLYAGQLNTAVQRNNSEVTP